MDDHVKLYKNAAVAAVLDQTLSPGKVADEIVAQCTRCGESAPTGDTDIDEEGDTPWLSSFLWDFWARLLRIAQEDASTHDRLAQILAALKTKGAAGYDGWQVYGTAFAWKDLTLFGLLSREDMNGAVVQPRDGLSSEPDIDTPHAQAILSGDPPSDDPASQALAAARNVWLNMNAFLARLWALDVVDEAFFGISTMRMQLEPLTLCSMSGPTPATMRKYGTEMSEPQELQIEIAATWLSIAGARMFACREIMGPKGDPDWDPHCGCPGGSGGTWDGVDGYHPDRWVHWKDILQEVVKGTWRKNVIGAAQAALDTMSKIEHDAAST